MADPRVAGRGVRQTGGAHLTNDFASLRNAYPWPKQPPTVAEHRHGWFHDQNKQVLLTAASHLRFGNLVQYPFIVELGSWLGESARWMLDQDPCLTVACVDTWLGSRDHHNPRSEYHPMLPTLYETFLRNMWDYRDRCIPVRADTITGLGAVLDHGLRPDLVYVDAGHDAWSVYADVMGVMEFFPGTHMVGDDWSHPAVQRGVRTAFDHAKPKIQLNAENNLWWTV